MTEFSLRENDADVGANLFFQISQKKYDTSLPNSYTHEGKVGNNAGVRESPVHQASVQTVFENVLFVLPTLFLLSSSLPLSAYTATQN